MSAFAHMADTLVRLRPQRARSTEEVEKTGTRVGAIRTALRQGPKSARELAISAGVTTSLVGALLKADLHSGRVRAIRGRALTLYELSTEFDEDLHRRISEARRLLASNGYVVTRGEVRDRQHQDLSQRSF